MKTFYVLISTFLIPICLLGCQDNSKEIGEDPITDYPTNGASQLCRVEKEPFHYSVCQLNQSELLTNKHKSLKLFWRTGNQNTNKSVKPLLNFKNLLADLSMDKTLIFAVNAGMYNKNYAPIGYTVINGEQVLSLNLNKGAGNFHLMPNGVFWWDKKEFGITESHQMSKKLKAGLKPLNATQSGPMLVIDGKIHPDFKANSDSKKIRNGVGVCKDGQVKLVNSNVLVNFYEMASLFKNELKCDNALFLDGGIASAMYAPQINRYDRKDMGVMIALVMDGAKKE